MEPKLSLLEFAYLARHNKPLASSLACLLIADCQTKKKPLPVETDTCDGWEQRMIAAFDDAAEGNTSYEQLRLNVIEFGLADRKEAEKVSS